LVLIRSPITPYTISTSSFTQRVGKNGLVRIKYPHNDARSIPRPPATRESPTVTHPNAM
jgi:hypothetical protein